jgi:hypothetical protein
VAVPASAQGAEKFYGGKINNGGTIGVEVEMLSGEPFQVLAMRYKKLNANCTGGSFLIGSSWFFNNATVENDRFEIDGTSGSGGNIYFKGRFSPSAKRLEGQLQEGPTNFGGNAGTCTSPKRGYTARRGADGPKPQAKAKVHRAFRVAK